MWSPGFLSKWLVLFSGLYFGSFSMVLYVDGFQQPGCEVTEVPLNLIQANDLSPLELAQREILACNHNRAIYYFLESISNSCQYIGHACSDYNAYLKVKSLAVFIDESCYFGF